MILCRNGHDRMPHERCRTCRQASRHRSNRKRATAAGRVWRHPASDGVAQARVVELRAMYLDGSYMAYSAAVLGSMIEGMARLLVLG